MHEQLALFANLAFYQAFSDRDMERMHAVWAQRLDITCIHPGWPMLAGHSEVLTSWERILANPQSPTASCYGARAFVYDTTVSILCYEQVGDAVGIATNLFAMEGEGMVMVHHQGAPCAAAPANEERAQRPQ